MLEECLAVFKQVLERDPNVIFREYIPANGTYLLVGKDDQLKGYPMEIQIDKKTGTIDKSAVYFKEFCIYDYYSKLISMNKPLDPSKVIHSNNLYSFFVKKENIVNGKLTEAVIDKYYEILENPIAKYSNGKTRSLYEKVEKKFGKVDVQLLEKNKNWIKEHIFSICDLVSSVDLGKKDYLKIFFEAEPQEYEREGNRYFIPNIYNSNYYNVEVEDRVYGLPDNNLGMNAKKPFLGIKTRKVPAPYLLDEEAVILQKKLFDYFMNFVSAGKYNVYVDLERNRFEACRNDTVPMNHISGIFLRLQKGKNEAEIHYQDVVPYYQKELEEAFPYRNYMQVVNEKHPEKEAVYGMYETLLELEGLVDDIMYSKYLKNNYFTEPDKLRILDERLKKNLLLHRQELFSWFRMNRKNGIKKIVEQVFLQNIVSSVLNGYHAKAVKQINLRLSFLQYLERGESYMPDFSVKMREDLKEKVMSKESVGFANDTEYYYAVGQVMRYFIYLNKSSKRDESLINVVLNARDSHTINARVERYYERYNYAISSKRVNNLCKMIWGYETQEKVKRDMICMGYVDNNILLEKKEENHE